MNEREKLLRSLSAVQFAVWELHIYLDTHPCDRTALALEEKYNAEAAVLRKKYIENYGPLSPVGAEASEWLSDPWPWDLQKGEK